MSVWNFAELVKDCDSAWIDDDHLDADIEALSESSYK